MCRKRASASRCTANLTTWKPTSRSRRTARRLGIEKLVIRQQSMYLFLVGEENVAYYQSPAFGRLLQYLQQNPKRCGLRQKNGRRSIVIFSIPSVSSALTVLRTITHLDSI